MNDKSTTTLKDGTTVKWTINANENNNYQNKLDEALLNQDSAADDDKIDIFLIEADYALKYVDSDYVLDVKKDIGLTDSDLAGQYQYTKDIVSVDGSQRGTTWQATPGLFAYRRSIAKEVLGTEDPAEVQTYLSDWDKFNDVAAKAAAKGYKMLSGFDDAYRTFSNNVSAPWVTGTTVTVDENLMKWVDQTKEYTDKGYNNKSSLWDSQCKVLLQIQNVQLGSAGSLGLFLQAVQLGALAHVTGNGDDFAVVVVFLQPGNDDGGIQTTGVCQHDFFDVFLFHNKRAPFNKNTLLYPDAHFPFASSVFDSRLMLLLYAARLFRQC